MFNFPSCHRRKEVKIECRSLQWQGEMLLLLSSVRRSSLSSDSREGNPVVVVVTSSFWEVREKQTQGS